MESLYSDEIRRFFHTRQWPKGLQVLITEEKTHLQFVLFRDNFNAFDGEDQKQIAGQVKEFMEKVRGMGIPIYLQVAKGDGSRGGT